MAVARCTVIFWISLAPHPNQQTEAPGFHNGATKMNVDGIRTNHSRLPARISFPTAGRPASAARNPGSGYLGDIRRFSILEKDLEYRLAKRWREHGDRKAADQIVTSHLR